MLRRRARVLYSYTPANDDELALEVNDVIEVLEDVEEGWWCGTLKGKKGVFPTNFVEVIDEVFESPDKNEKPLPRSESEQDQEFASMGSSSTSRSPEIKPKPVRGVGLGNIFQDGMVKLKPTDVSGDKKVSSMPKKPPPPVPDDVTVPKLPPKLVREQARVLYSYEAQNEDELTIKEGDLINIITKDVEDKGWWRGEHQGKVGVFPNNFVELCHNDDVQVAPPVKPARPEKPLKAMRGAKLSKKSIPGDQHAMPDVVPEDKKQPPQKPPPPFSLPDHLKRGGSIEERKDKPAPPLPGKKPPLPAPVKKPQRLSLYSQTNSPLSEDPSSKGPSTSVQSNISTACNGDEHGTDAKSNQSPKNTDAMDEAAFDNIASSPEKLTHLTATRAKVPNRRPPSHLFTKDVIKEDDVIANENDISSASEVKTDKKTTEVRKEDRSKQLLASKGIHLSSENGAKCPSMVGSSIKSPIKEPMSCPLSIAAHATVHQQPVPPHTPTTTTTSLNPVPGSLPDDRAVSKSTYPSGEAFVTRSEFDELANQVAALKDLVEQQKSHYTRLVKNLMAEIDEEKKSRIALQVEVDRLKKITAIV